MVSLSGVSITSLRIVFGLFLFLVFFSLLVSLPVLVLFFQRFLLPLQLFLVQYIQHFFYSVTLLVLFFHCSFSHFSMINIILKRILFSEVKNLISQVLLFILINL